MNQHVFRETADGDLEPVFDFEALYRSEDDPWDQSGKGDPDKAAYYASSRHRLLRAIRERVYGGHRGLEVGCGHGHALAYLAQSMRAWHTKWSGLDISPTAIATARLLHPGLDFYVEDIAGEVFTTEADVSREMTYTANDLARGRFDVVVLNQVWWYVLERLPAAIENCWELVKPGGLLIISQGFLRGEQRYARDLADGFPGAVGLMLRLCSRRFQLISATYDDTGSYPLNDGLMIFRRIA